MAIWIGAQALENTALLTSCDYQFQNLKIR